jgi:transposase-like protein
VDVLVAQGQSVADVVRAIGVTEVTYYRWRQEYGGLKRLKTDQVRRLKELETENARLRRAATFLRKVGIEIGFDREGRARTRTIRITAATQAGPEDAGMRPSAPSAASAPVPKSSGANGFAAPDPRTVADDADGTSGGVVPTVRANSLPRNAGTAADGADANQHSQSGPEKAGASRWRTRF